MTVTWYQWQGNDLILRVRVQPRASRDEIAGPHGECLRVRIVAPPVDGKANAHLRRFFARLFQVSPAKVTLVAGETGREKRLRIQEPRHLLPGIKLPSAGDPVA